MYPGHVFVLSFTELIHELNSKIAIFFFFFALSERLSVEISVGILVKKETMQWRHITIEYAYCFQCVNLDDPRAINYSQCNTYTHTHNDPSVRMRSTSVDEIVSDDDDGYSACRAVCLQSSPR